MSAESVKGVPEESRQELEEVPKHRDHWRVWYAKGLCVTCGGPKEYPDPHHCDECYGALYGSIADYDDD